MYSQSKPEFKQGFGELLQPAATRADLHVLFCGSSLSVPAILVQGYTRAPAGHVRCALCGPLTLYWA